MRMKPTKLERIKIHRLKIESEDSREFSRFEFFSVQSRREKVIWDYAKLVFCINNFLHRKNISPNFCFSEASPENFVKRNQ